MATSRLLAACRWKASVGKALAACVGLTIAGICAVLLAGGPWLLPAAALVGFAMGPIYAYLVDWMCTANGSSASMIAVSMALGTLGPVLTGPLAGSLGDRFGAKAVMAVPLGACIAILLLLRLSVSRKVAP
jgi:fucose permease